MLKLYLCGVSVALGYQPQPQQICCGEDPVSEIKTLHNRFRCTVQTTDVSAFICCYYFHSTMIETDGVNDDVML